MRLSELTDYARERYQIQERRGWEGIPGVSVLCHPQTGRWVALLMRRRDAETGREIECCDLKCGEGSFLRPSRPYLARPFRMHGGKWLGVVFDDRTERDVVLRLFDRAVGIGEAHGFTIVLDSREPGGGAGFRDTPLPFARSVYRPPRDETPARIREMRRLCRGDGGSEAVRSMSFLNQAAFMADYEDDVPWTGAFSRFLPTYQDMTTRQLRGYFTWRARARRGDFQPIPASAACIYIYELLNGVGAEGPEDALQKMLAFEAGYLGAGYGDAALEEKLRRWMLEYAVVNDLPPETARQAADPAMIGEDAALAALREPDGRPDEAVFAALCRLGGGRTAESPVIAADPERGRRLFSAAWRAAVKTHGGKLFAMCFGEPVTRQWFPMIGAIWRAPAVPKDRRYDLDECRSFTCNGGRWQTTGHERVFYDRPLFLGFLHQTDARLRRWLKTRGRTLREKPEEAWAIPCAEAAIEAEQRAAAAAARREFTIDLSGLDRIRSDAAVTRDSLLAGEETEETEAVAAPPVQPESGGLPLDGAQRRILRALLRGEDPSEILRAGHMLPSVAADAINEALFDAIGDAALTCEDGRLALVEDYIEDLRRLLGGNADG